MKSWRGLGRLPLFEKNQSGYTITEVLIVLAVSTALFVVIALSFNGRQARAEFTQAVRNFEAQLQTTITETSSSTYQTANCRAGGSNGSPVFSGATNDGSCIFLGKAFLPSTAEAETSILTLIGRRTTGNPPETVTSLADAEGVVAPGVETYNHSYQLGVTRIVRQGDTDVRLYALGFINSLTGSSTPGAGSNLYGLLTSSFTDNSIDSNFIVLSDGAIICLQGQNGQRAEIRVGGADSQTQLISELDTGETEACRD